MIPDQDPTYGELLRYVEAGESDGIGYVEFAGDYEFETMDPADYIFSRYAEWPAYLQEAIDSAEGPVLDVGTGAGRHALYLQERGIPVTAIDIDPDVVEVARRQGVHNVREVSLEQVAELPDQYRTILLGGNNLAIFQTIEHGQEYLHLLDRITTPDARILAETANPYRVETVSEEFHEHIYKVHRASHLRGRLAGQITMQLRQGLRRSEPFDLLFLSPEEIEHKLLPGTPWEVDRYFDTRQRQYVAALKKRQI